jgi:hypothetical protein
MTEEKRAPFYNRSLFIFSGLVVITRLLAGPWIIDDAYITFRYARNAADGLGLVFNAGQPVLGTSSPLFALILSFIYRISGAGIPSIALVLSSLADGLSVLLLFKMAHRLRFPRWAAFLLIFCWALYPLAIRYTLSGMETSLVTFLILGAFVCFLYDHFKGAIAIASLALLTRPDAALVLVLLFLSRIIDSPGKIGRDLLIPLALLLPWVLFATLYYGNPIPQSIWAKSHRIYLVPPFSNFLQIYYNFSGIFLNSLYGLSAEGITFNPPRTLFWPMRLFGILQLSLWILGFQTALRKNKKSLFIFLFPILFCLAYGLVGLRGKAMAEWYMVPLAPFYFFGIILGLVRLSTLTPLKKIVPLIACIVLAAIQVSGFNLSGLPDRNFWVPPAVSITREKMYQQVSLNLRNSLKPDTVIAAPEIGTLGYFCPCLILDTAGLVSPEALKFFPIPKDQYYINYAVPPALILSSRPDYFISLDAFYKNSLMREEWFQKQYRLIDRMEANIFASPFLNTYKRN